MNELREEHRLEWENLVISFINRGYSKSDAKHAADEIIRYEDESDEE